MSELKEELEELIAKLESKKDDRKSQLAPFLEKPKLTNDEMCKGEYMRGEIFTLTCVISDLQLLKFGME